MGSLLSVLLALAPVQDPAPAVEVGPVPEQLRLERDLDPFYGKHCAVEGFPILGSMRVSDAALREALGPLLVDALVFLKRDEAARLEKASVDEIRDFYLPFV